MDVLIRQAELRDIPDLLDMNEIFNGKGLSTAVAMKRDLESNAGEMVFVAECGGMAVGFICGQVFSSICYADAKLCTVMELFVREEYRRYGIASKLMLRLEQEFEEHSALEILLQTGGENDGAQRFYENIGYIDTKRIVYRKVKQGGQ
ncbi:MAG: GNAT family N-acetyltransferase [Defluviitaleaceae bacterium]|nr:GNAT family N-acetyltransferase [Defluviitaleaceae bacterium]